MIYALTFDQQQELLSMPETGMGYQIIEAKLKDSYSSELYFIINSQIAIDMNSNLNSDIKSVINEGINKIQLTAITIDFSEIRLFSEVQFRNIVNETPFSATKGATENPIIKASGLEKLARLSAFTDDRRIDKINNRLLPGSYTTSVSDYLYCKKRSESPNDRYALPNDDKIEYIFYISPITGDIYQNGIVQPAYGKSGGGEEYFFSAGTSKGTFIPPEKPY